MLSRGVVYTDGAFAAGKGGYGWVYLADGQVSTSMGYGPAGSTNNQSELLAIIRALETIASRPITLYTDSEYSMKSLTVWYAGWAKRGFRNARGQPVANLELIQKARSLCHGVEIRHVYGHRGHRWNEMADRLADLGRTAPEDVVVPLSMGDILVPGNPEI